jgi:anti-sigma B factor antagonist
MAFSPAREPAGDEYLHLELRRHETAAVVRVAGEIDLSNHLRLRAAVLDACEAVEPPKPVVLDLTGVEFIASVGLSELLVCHRHASGRQTPLRVVADASRVLRPIEVAGLLRLLDVYRCLDEALIVDGSTTWGAQWRDGDSAEPDAHGRGR